jgi:hypothetical protein
MTPVVPPADADDRDVAGDDVRPVGTFAAPGGRFGLQAQKLSDFINSAFGSRFPSHRPRDSTVGRRAMFRSGTSGNR